MLFAQYQVQISSGEPQTLKVSVPAYNDRIPAAVMTMKFEFDANNETILVSMGSGGVASPNYDKVWLPQHRFSYVEMPDYMKSRGVKLKKAQTFIDQENFLNLGSKPVAAGIACEGMTFTGAYNLKSPKKVKKELDNQMVPLDGQMELNLKFNVANNRSDLALTLRNPMPMHRKGSKGTIAYMADDITIDIQIDRCKESRPLLATIKEYLAMFQVGEAKLNELKKSGRSLMDKMKNLLNEQYAQIDLNRFKDTGCAEFDEYLDELEDCIQRIRESEKAPATSSSGSNNDSSASCDVKKLNAEIKSTTTKLNNLVNDWSLASTPATKAEKKASFDATVKSFDAKLNSLPNNCKGKLDAKLLKNYEFVKKLIK